MKCNTISIYKTLQELKKTFDLNECYLKQGLAKIYSFGEYEEVEVIRLTDKKDDVAYFYMDGMYLGMLEGVEDFKEYPDLI